MSINQSGEDEKAALLSSTPDSTHHHHHHHHRDTSLDNLLIKDDRSFLQRQWDDTRKRFTPEHEFMWYVRYYANPKHSFLLLLTAALILVGTANRVFFKKMLIPMVNYPYFISQLSTTVPHPLPPNLTNQSILFFHLYVAFHFIFNRFFTLLLLRVPCEQNQEKIFIILLFCIQNKIKYKINGCLPGQIKWLMCTGVHSDFLAGRVGLDALHLANHPRDAPVPPLEGACPFALSLSLALYEAKRSTHTLPLLCTALGTSSSSWAPSTPLPVC
jgi:hypothetical protein